MNLCRCGCGAEVNNLYLPGHNRATSSVKYLIDEETGCWEWQRCKNPNGYGQICIDGKHHGAHRYYYEIHIGPIPEGLQLDHLCRNRGCCNPAHLEPVTNAQNHHRGNNAKLNWELVDEIRSSTESNTAIAKRMGLGYMTINAVRRGISWKESEREVLA